MAMVKITNGSATQYVTRGAYETQYKRLGFWIDCEPAKQVVNKHVKEAEHTKEVKETEVLNEVAEDSDEIEDFEELLEKPLSQWTNEELKAFVNANGIDTSSAKKTSEVRGIVKRYLDDEAKKAAGAL